MSDSNLSALSALSTRQEVTANNIANISTDGFKASSVALETGPEGEGVRVGAIQESSTPGSLVGDVETSNTDLAGETVDMITSSRAFSANVVAIRASEEMTGHLLNMIA